MINAHVKMIIMELNVNSHVLVVMDNVNKDNVFVIKVMYL